MRKSEDQRVIYGAVDLTSATATQAALDHVTRLQHHMPPTYIFCCTGGATPGLFLPCSAQLLASGMQWNYLPVLFTIHASLRKLVQSIFHISNAEEQDEIYQKCPSLLGTKIIVTSSILGMLGIPGYTHYAPAKFALRGLVECLRMELQMYHVDIHLFLPGNMQSPGFDRENATKPELTRRIEGASDAITSDQAMEALFYGLRQGRYMITCDPVGEILIPSAAPVGPGNGIVWDALWDGVRWLAMGWWRRYSDWLTRREPARMDTLLKEVEMEKHAQKLD